MSGSINVPDAVREAGQAETISLVHEIIAVCDGRDTAAVLAALSTVCAISLHDIGVDVEMFVGRLRANTAKLKRADRARKEATPT